MLYILSLCKQAGEQEPLCSISLLLSITNTLRGRRICLTAMHFSVIAFYNWKSGGRCGLFIFWLCSLASCLKRTHPLKTPVSGHRCCLRMCTAPCGERRGAGLGAAPVPVLCHLLHCQWLILCHFTHLQTLRATFIKPLPPNAIRTLLQERKNWYIMVYITSSKQRRQAFALLN